MALRFFGKLPSPVGWGAVSDGQGSGGTVARQPPDLAGIPQQQDITFYPVGRKVLYPESGLREVLEANYRKPLKG